MITGSWTARTVLELTRSLVTRVLVGGIQKATSSRKLKISDLLLTAATTGNPGSVIVPQYGSSKIAVFVWSKNIILKFLRNTK